MKHFTKNVLVGYFFCTPSIFYIDPQEVLDLLSNQSPKQEGFRKKFKTKSFHVLCLDLHVQYFMQNTKKF